MRWHTAFGKKNQILSKVKSEFRDGTFSGIHHYNFNFKCTEPEYRVGNVSSTAGIDASKNHEISLIYTAPFKPIMHYLLHEKPNHYLQYSPPIYT